DLQLFDAVLAVSPHAVELPNDLGRAGQVRDDVAVVASGSLAGSVDDFRLEDHATSTLPGTCAVEAVAEECGRLVEALGEGPCSAHVLIGDRRQVRVPRHRHHVLDAQLVQHFEESRMSETSIEAHTDLRLAEGVSELLDDAAQQRNRASYFLGDTGAKACIEEVLLSLTLDAEESEHGQVAPGVIVPVEVGEGLLSMRRIDRGIQVDEDAPRARVTDMKALDDDSFQLSFHRDELASAYRAFEARERRLRGEAIRTIRATTTCEEQRRIPRELRGVVRVGAAKSDRVDPLPKELFGPMRDTSRMPAILEARRERSCQPKPAVEARE